MADYQILKITLKDAGQNETTYFGHEVVGSRALGGNLEPPYPKEKIISVHAYYAKKRAMEALDLIWLLPEQRQSTFRFYTRMSYSIAL